MALRHFSITVPTTRRMQSANAFGMKRGVEELWRDFFLNTSQWWDHRPEKINPRFPDFKHKQTQESLWLTDARTPPWVPAELAAIPPGTLQANAFAWTQRLKRHVKAGQYLKTMEVFHQMQEEGIFPDSRTFLPVLNACAGLGALRKGKQVHSQIIQVGCESDIYVGNCLVDMYSKCGSIEDAWNVFNKMNEHDVVTWNAMIGGYVKAGQGLKAMDLYQEMQQERVEPDDVTFVGVLSACASVMALEEGRRVHEQIMQRNCRSDIYVDNCLVDMYAKCGSIVDAWSVFDKMVERNVVTWTALIGGYVKSGEALKAMELFRQMEQEGVEPNVVTFVGMLNACANVKALEEGRSVHEHIIGRGYDSDVYVGNCLVDMYTKCGSIGDAWTVFNKMQKRDVITWSAIISGFVKSEQGLKAMELFRQMQGEGVEPNEVTFVGMLNACASVADLKEGRCVHEQITRRGYQSDVFVSNSLVDMYAKCGSIEDAWSVFKTMTMRDVVTWNVMIDGYVKLEQGLKAMRLFQEMEQDGVKPNSVSFIGMLNACASVAALEEGRYVHKLIVQRGFESDIHVGNCLLHMYAKCGSIEDAWNMFNKMSTRDVFAWNAMIGGYVKSGQGLKVMELFCKMEEAGVEPNMVTFVGVLNACASVAAFEEGKRVHGEIIRRGCQSDVYMGNSLVDMYAKCGSIEDAWSVFHKMPIRDVVSWTAMIGGYAMHGHAKKAIGLFKQMDKESIEINAISFTCLLSACSHGGLVKEGLRYFKSMSSCYKILPNAEHYACMVDLFARAGQLTEAEELMLMMPLEADVYVWMSLLAACRIHANIGMAERAARRCLELDPENASGHLLLSNVYAAAEMWS